MSQLMKLWHFSSSVNSFFKRTCAATQCAGSNDRHHNQARMQRGCRGHKRTPLDGQIISKSCSFCFNTNWVYTPKFGPKIRIFLSFAPPLCKIPEIYTTVFKSLHTGLIKKCHKQVTKSPVSLGIWIVWSEYLLSLWRSFVILLILRRAHNEASNQTTNVQASQRFPGHSEASSWPSG